MQAFKFRLQTLLECRKREKEQAQTVYAQAVRQLEQEKTVLAQLEHEYSNTINLYCDTQTKNITIETLKSFNYYLDKIKEDIHRQICVVDDKNKIKDEYFNVLLETAKKYEITDKLRNNQLLAYRQTILREEQKQLDEIALQLYTRDQGDDK